MFMADISKITLPNGKEYDLKDTTARNAANTHISNKSNPHGVTKAQVGLGNVDNTADSAKSVKYAASAGSANSVVWGNVSGRPSSLPANGGNSSTVNGHTVNSDVPSGAKFTDTVYDDTAVREMIAGKQDTLTFDDTPTADSTNPVTSGGIKAYVDANAKYDDTALSNRVTVLETKTPKDLTDSIKDNYGSNAVNSTTPIGSYFSIVKVGKFVICSLNINLKKNSSQNLGVFYGLPKAKYPANASLGYNNYSSVVTVFIRAGQSQIFTGSEIPYNGFVGGQLIYITDE